MAPMAGFGTLVLASSSPRRRVLLRRAGYDFTVVRPTIDEVALGDESPHHLAARLATEKAIDVSTREGPAAPVLGADTIVTLDGDVLGKPVDASDAVAMLLRLGGRSHQVVTGYALARAGSLLESGTATTGVVFRPIDPSVAATYVESGEPLDKAGAYAIQGMGRRFVSEIEGSFTNVMGLPMDQVEAMLERHGVRPA